MSLNPDQLAQFRGCEPWNECYADCVDAARSTIDAPATDDLEELADAEAWAATQQWSSAGA